MTTIAANFDAMWLNYMRRPLIGSFKAHIDALEKARLENNKKPPPAVQNPYPNTPCVIQLCHGLTKAGITIPPHSFWRSNPRIDGAYYLQAVNELETYLNQRFFRGTPVGTGTVQQKQARLRQKKGILTFGAVHCELWKIDQILQRDSIPLPSGGSVDGMSGKIWASDRIMFWEIEGTADLAPRTAVPDKLLGWWKVTDPNTDNIYYYYFETDYVVFYTKSAPKRASEVPNKTGVNYGKVSLLPTSPLSFRIDWNPADGGVTIENFVEVTSASIPMLSGSSIRYGKLNAVKLV